ncbi:MAG: glycosyltransferase family 4 protein, partial [Chloroflexota bacterium]
TADDLMRFYGLPASKIEVIYAAADRRFRRIDRQAAEQLLAGVDVPRPFILTVGTLEPRKNLARLLDAFSSLDLPHHLVAAGARGWLYEDLEARLRRAGVVVLDRVSDDQLVALYNLADLFVYPSLYEGFGLPPLEAMSCGTPVAASNRSSLPEVVGQAGLLFDPEDTAAIATALARLVGDHALRAELAEAGRLQAARFSWPDSAGRLKAVYERLGGG